MDNTRLKSRLSSNLNTRQQPETTNERITNMPTNTVPTAPISTTTMPETTTALAPIETGYIALRNNALDIIRENLKNQTISYALFDVIKSPSGGATAFTIPTMSGEEIQREITGIILDYDTPRAYWNTPDPVEGTPPTCYSHDSLVSFDGKPCNRCAYNDFGSKNGETNAKACKESITIYLLREENIMPIIVRVPVSSKMAFQRYMTRLIGKMIPVYGVVTKITLEKATSKTGQPYAQYNFEAVKQLSPEETASAKAFGQEFMEVLKAADIESIRDAA
jgi:hypothetical protein